MNLPPLQKLNKENGTEPGPNCPQPPHKGNPNSLSATERALFGFPDRVPGKDFTTVDLNYMLHGKHYCSDTDGFTTYRNTGICDTHTTSSPCDIGSNIWAGNIADGNAGNYSTLGIPIDPAVQGQETYIESDFNWYAPTVGPGVNDSVSVWTGLGGNGNKNLVQTGSAVRYYWWGRLDKAWVENTASTGSDQGNEVDVFDVNEGDYMFAQVKNGNCMLVMDITLNKSSGWRCYGPSADKTTAEFIVERPTCGANCIWPLSNFGTQTLYYCGVTPQSGPNANKYIGIGQAQHDFSDMRQNVQTGNVLASTNPIFLHPGNIPEDSFSVTWFNYQ